MFLPVIPNFYNKNYINRQLKFTCLFVYIEKHNFVIKNVYDLLYLYYVLSFISTSFMPHLTIRKSYKS